GLRWQSVDFERLVMVVTDGYARSQTTKLKSEYSRTNCLWTRMSQPFFWSGSGFAREPRGTGFSPARGPTDRTIQLSAPKGVSAGRSGQDSRSDRLALTAPQLSLVARRNWSAIGRSAEADAPRQHLNHDERVRWRFHGCKAQSEHIGRAARSLPKNC